MKRSLLERVDRFRATNPQGAKLMVEDMNEIAELGDLCDIIATAFYFGYMKGSRARKRGAT